MYNQTHYTSQDWSDWTWLLWQLLSARFNCLQSQASFSQTLSCVFYFSLSLLCRYIFTLWFSFALSCHTAIIKSNEMKNIFTLWSLQVIAFSHRYRRWTQVCYHLIALYRNRRREGSVVLFAQGWFRHCSSQKNPAPLVLVHQSCIVFSFSVAI